jgi:holin-like protein
MHAVHAYSSPPFFHRLVLTACFAMIYALTALFVFQLLGELVVRWLGIPLPGALVGTLLLLAVLLMSGRLPAVLEQVGGRLLQNMMLLFIPSIAGVMLEFDHIAKEWLPLLVAGIGATAITFVVTALTFRWMLRWQQQHKGLPEIEQSPHPKATDGASPGLRTEAGTVPASHPGRL